MYFYGFNPEPPGAGPSGTLRPLYEQNGYRTNRQCQIPSLKYLKQVVMEDNIFDYFSMYVYTFNPGHLRWGHFGPWLVGCFGLNGPLRQYFSLYRAVSQREGERKEKR